MRRKNLMRLNGFIKECNIGGKYETVRIEIWGVYNYKKESKKCQYTVYLMYINRNDGTKQRISDLIEKAGVLYYE